jgi:ubiquinone biosynthesis monooxygenase Coq6
MASLLLFSNNYDTGYFTYDWQVWDYTGLGYTRYNARDVGKEYLGYAITKAAVIC